MSKSAMRKAATHRLLLGPRGAPAGFTLLEVMAAVAILGYVFISLASGSIQGIDAESRARRTIDASLRADEILADIEQSSALFASSAEHYEGEEDPYYIRVVGPLPHPISGEQDAALAGFRVEVWDLDQTQRLAQRTTYAFDIAALEEELDAAGLLGNGASLGAAATESPPGSDAAGGSDSDAPKNPNPGAAL